MARYLIELIKHLEIRRLGLSRALPCRSAVAKVLDRAAAPKSQLFSTGGDPPKPPVATSLEPCPGDRLHVGQ